MDSQTFRIAAVWSITFAGFGVVAWTSVSSRPRCVSIVAMCACMSPIFIGGIESVRMGIAIGVVIGVVIGMVIGFGIVESRRADRVIAPAESFVIGMRIVVPTVDIWA